VKETVEHDQKERHDRCVVWDSETRRQRHAWITAQSDSWAQVRA